MSGDLPTYPNGADHQVVVWRRLDAPGMEYCEISPIAKSGWRLRGHVVTLADGAPAHLEYMVRCDGEWRTDGVHLRAELWGKQRLQHLRRTPAGEWMLDEAYMSALSGCLDVDLGFSPITNTLPIRRLGLALGKSGEIAAAWVRFPALDIVSTRQRYTRLGEHTYRYENLESGYTADLEVDMDGLVVTYPGVWERIASG